MDRRQRRTGSRAACGDVCSRRCRDRGFGWWMRSGVQAWSRRRGGSGRSRRSAVKSSIQAGHEIQRPSVLDAHADAGDAAGIAGKIATRARQADGLEVVAAAIRGEITEIPIFDMTLSGPG